MATIEPTSAPGHELAARLNRRVRGRNARVAYEGDLPFGSGSPSPATGSGTGCACCSSSTTPRP
ncbi:MAG: hypothetical protein M5U28_47635 [Sandaracinaceae bacterium]|nr:hypothetical protein [Sandaracinaceae bacterium]